MRSINFCLRIQISRPPISFSFPLKNTPFLFFFLFFSLFFAFTRTNTHTQARAYTYTSTHVYTISPAPIVRYSSFIQIHANIFQSNNPLTSVDPLASITSVKEEDFTFIRGNSRMISERVTNFLLVLSLSLSFPIF